MRPKKTSQQKHTNLKKFKIAQANELNIVCLYIKSWRQLYQISLMLARVEGDLDREISFFLP